MVNLKTTIIQYKKSKTGKKWSLELQDKNYKIKNEWEAKNVKEML